MGFYFNILKFIFTLFAIYVSYYIFSKIKKKSKGDEKSKIPIKKKQLENTDKMIFLYEDKTSVFSQMLNPNNNSIILNLTKIDIINCKLFSLEGIDQCVNLKRLGLTSCPNLKDLTPLTLCKNLEYLDLLNLLIINHQLHLIENLVSLDITGSYINNLQLIVLCKKLHILFYYTKSTKYKNLILKIREKKQGKSLFLIDNYSNFQI